MIKHRLDIHSNQKWYYDFLDNIKKYSGSCDEVWFGVHRLGESLSEISAFLDFLSPIAEEYRKNGIKVSVEVNGFGHCVRQKNSIIAAEIAGVKNVSDDDYAVDSHGDTLYGIFCANSRAWRDYRVSTVKEICKKLRPYAFYFDDDVRIKNWDGGVRCFCKTCVKRFNAEHGTDYTQSEALDKFNSDKAFRAEWIEQSCKSLEEYCFEMGKAMAETCPETHPALQHGAFSGDSYLRAIKGFREGSGNTVMSRSGGGSYNDANPNELISKSYTDLYQLARLPEYVEDRCHEVENYPRSFFSKTPYGTCLEVAMHLAEGFNSSSFMMTGVMEDRDVRNAFYRETSLRKEYWKKLVSANAGGIKSGLSIYIPKNYWNGDGKNWDIDPSGTGYAYNYLGIPMTYGKTADEIYTLPEEFVELLSDEEIEYLMTRPVVMSGNALFKLGKRCASEKFGGRSVHVSDGCPYRESYTKHSLNSVTDESGWGQSLWGRDDYYIELYGDSESISEYTHTKDANFFEKPNGCCAAAILHTSAGAKWFVQGYHAFDTVITYGKKQQIEAAVEYISGKPMISRIATKNRGMLIPCERNGELTSVSLINTTIEEQRDVGVFLRTAGEVRCLDEFGRELAASVKRTAEGVTVTLPSLAPWRMLTVFVR